MFSEAEGALEAKETGLPSKLLLQSFHFDGMVLG
jgi:hypothetical protein